VALGVEDSNILTAITTPMGNKMANQSEVMDLVAAPDFEQIISKTLQNEGGIAYHNMKYGGITKYGIPKKYYPQLDIKDLTPEQAKEIYRKDYFEGPGINQIGYPNVAYKVFDYGVTSGPQDSIKLLQSTLNGMGSNLKVDGRLGPKTLSELYKYHQDAVANAFENAVKNKYKSLGTRKYMKGWIKRAER
jgi:lysozyme family protein